MEQQKAGLYLGIDISDKYTMLSIYQQHMTEPQTISTIMGSGVGEEKRCGSVVLWT